MNTPQILLSIIAFAVASTALFAKDEDPVRAEAARLMQQASQAKVEGRYEEAREFANKARQLTGEVQEGERKKDSGHKDADRPKDERIGQMKREIEELRREGKHEAAEQRVRALKSLGREHSDAEGPEKIRHVVEAVRHLKAAGLDEPAERLGQQAGRMREEFEQRRHEREKSERRHEDKDSSSADSRGEVRELREQVQKLEKELQQLRGEVRKRGTEAPKVE